MSEPQIQYRIVYPGGDREALSVAGLYDYERNDYDMASSKVFETREAAVTRMQELAVKHGLNCTPRPQKLLD